MLMGCATMIPVGGLYTGVKVPVIATSNSGASSKTGEAKWISVLSLIAIGDCSIDAAKKNGGITKRTMLIGMRVNVGNLRILQSNRFRRIKKRSPDINC